MELFRERREARDRRVAFGGLRPGEEAVPLLAAEIRALEELGREDHRRALLRGRADEGLDLCDVLVHGARKRALDGCERDIPDFRHAGTCWLMQWNAPPPSRSRRAGIETARRPGQSRPMATRAGSSFGTPYAGTTTVVFAT